MLVALVWVGTRPPLSPLEFTRRLVAAAIERTHHSVREVSAYVRIPYPGGDVPGGHGVCSDEIIGSYRAVGGDLQKQVHEDMLHRTFPPIPQAALAASPSGLKHRSPPRARI